MSSCLGSLAYGLRRIVSIEDPGHLDASTMAAGAPDPQDMVGMVDSRVPPRLGIGAESTMQPQANTGLRQFGAALAPFFSHCSVT